MEGVRHWTNFYLSLPLRQVKKVTVFLKATSISCNLFACSPNWYNKIWLHRRWACQNLEDWRRYWSQTGHCPIFFFSIQCKISRPISKLKSEFTILAFLLYIYHFLFISLIVSTTSHELSKLYCLVNSGFYILAIPLKALS